MNYFETYYTIMSRSCGQCHKDRVQTELDRLNKQELAEPRKNALIWVANVSPFIFVTDESDDDVANPCELKKDHVWIVAIRSYKIFPYTDRKGQWKLC